MTLSLILQNNDIIITIIAGFCSGCLREYFVAEQDFLCNHTAKVQLEWLFRVTVTIIFVDHHVIVTL